MLYSNTDLRINVNKNAYFAVKNKIDILIENALDGNEDAEKELLRQTNLTFAAEKLSLIILNSSENKKISAVNLLKKIITNKKIVISGNIISNLGQALKKENDFINIMYLTDLLSDIDGVSSSQILILKLQNSSDNKSIRRYILTSLIKMQFSQSQTAKILELMKDEDDLSVFLDFISVISTHTNKAQKQKIYPLIFEKLKSIKKEYNGNEDINVEFINSFSDLESLRNKINVRAEMSMTYYPAPDELSYAKEKYKEHHYIIMLNGKCGHKDKQEETLLISYSDNPRKDNYVYGDEKIKEVLRTMGILEGKGILIMAIHKGRMNERSCPFFLTNFGYCVHNHPEGEKPSEGDRDTYKKFFQNYEL